MQPPKTLTLDRNSVTPTSVNEEKEDNSPLSVDVSNLI